MADPDDTSLIPGLVPLERELLLGLSETALRVRGLNDGCSELERLVFIELNQNHQCFR